MGSMGQMHFDSSSREFYHRASETIFSDSPIARIVIGFINKFFPSGCSFLLVI